MLQGEFCKYVILWIALCSHCAYWTSCVFLLRSSTGLYMMLCIERYIHKYIYILVYTFQCITGNLGKFYSTATFTSVIAMCALWQCSILTLQPLIGFSCHFHLLIFLMKNSSCWKAVVVSHMFLIFTAFPILFALLRMVNSLPTFQVVYMFLHVSFGISILQAILIVTPK